MVDATDAHCIAAAIKYFGLQSQDDDPNKNLPPSQQANAKVKKEWLYQSANAILDSYAMADIRKIHYNVEGKKKGIPITLIIYDLINEYKHLSFSSITGILKWDIMTLKHIISKQHECKCKVCVEWDPKWLLS